MSKKLKMLSNHDLINVRAENVLHPWQPKAGL